MSRMSPFGVLSVGWMLVLGCLASIYLSSSRKPTVLIDYNYPAQLAAVQADPRSEEMVLVPMPLLKEWPTAEYWACTKKCKDLSHVCYAMPTDFNPPVSNPACEQFLTACTGKCDGPNVELAMRCYEANIANYRLCESKNKANPSGLSHCQALYSNGYAAC